MMQTSTDPRLVKLRKYESILVISGFGVIAFGLWSIIRAAIYYFLYPLDIANYIQQSDLDEIMALGQEGGLEVITDNLGTIVTVFIFIGLSIDLLFRVYVGFSARRDGRRLKKSGLYVLIAWIMAFLMFSHIVTVIDEFIKPIIDALADNPDTAFEETGSKGDQAASVSLIVDITSFLVLVEVGVCSMKVRRLRKKLGIVPDKRRKKGEKKVITGNLVYMLQDELNIPENKAERKELTEELGQRLNDGLSSISEGIRGE